VNGGALLGETLLNGVIWLYLLALIPAAVVTILKSRLSLFFAGFLTLGLTWVIAAAMLAEPDSDWAKWFYDERKLARSADPQRHPKPARETALLTGGAAALLLAVGLFASRPAPVLGVHGEALQYSVGGGNLGSSMPPCTRADDGAWRCKRSENGFSGTVSYRVETHGLGCWRAVRVGPRPAEGAPKRLSGCITIWDEIRLMNSLL